MPTVTQTCHCHKAGRFKHRQGPQKREAGGPEETGLLPHWLWNRSKGPRAKKPRNAGVSGSWERQAWSVP